jgi:hypothetical protein
MKRIAWGLLALVCLAAPARAETLTRVGGQAYLVEPDGTRQTVALATGGDGTLYALRPDATWLKVTESDWPVYAALRAIAVDLAMDEANTIHPDAPEARLVTRCLMDVFVELDDADMQTLVDVRIDPSREQIEDFERRYPGITRRVELCI